MGGQHDFGVDDVPLPGIVMGGAVPRVFQSRSADVGGCGDSGTSLVPRNDFDRAMKEIHRVLLFFGSRGSSVLWGMGLAPSRTQSAISLAERMTYVAVGNVCISAHFFSK